ncbi:hypothetical protein H8356DRAFT_884224, partial [Neocallimastix lanati (nom. inval.)]
MSDGYSSESGKGKQQKETRSQGKSEFLSRLRAFELKAQKEKEERENAYIPKASKITSTKIPPKNRNSPVYTPPTSPKTGSTIIRTSNYSRSFNPAESRKKEIYEEAKAKLENKIVQLEKELEEAKSKTKFNDGKETTTTNKDASKLTKEIDELKEKEDIERNDLKSEVTKLNESETASGEVEQLQKEIQVLKDQLTQLTKEAEEATASVKTLQGALDQKNASIE